MNANKISPPPAPSDAPLMFKTFGEWVKAARNEKGWSQAKLAGRSYCSLDTIRAIEQNRTNYRPSLAMASRLAECLEIPDARRAEFIRLARGETGESVETPALLPTAPMETPAIALSNKPSPLANDSLSNDTQRTLVHTFARKVLFSHSQFSVVTILLIVLVPLMLFLALGVWFVLQPQWLARASVELTPGPIALVNREPRVQVLVDGRAIANGDTIPRYARVVVKFAVENLGAQTVRLATLEAGARGPCTEKCTWASQGQTFNRVRNLALQPGEIFEYEANRVFTEPGNYFIEPVRQDTNGKYGGINPFSRVELRVGN